MKIRLLSVIVILISTFAAFPTYASDDYENTEKRYSCHRGHSPAEIQDYKDIVITPVNKKPLSAEQVRQAIAQAARKNKWIITETANEKAGGQIEASLLVRNKHTAVVEIPYTAEKYSILYKNSVNMNYASCNNTRYIHRNYNVWVNRLQSAIAAELDAIK